MPRAITPGLGRPRPGLRLAEERARPVRRSRGQRVGCGKRRDRQHDSEIHARGQVPHADRESRQIRGQQRKGPGRPANMVVDPGANELFVSDGYGNKRIVVSIHAPAPTSGTGAPTAACRATRKCLRTIPLRRRRSNSPTPVHCVRLSNDGLVYVCDRGNNRMQVFQQGRNLRDGISRSENRRAGLGRHSFVCRRGAAPHLSRRRPAGRDPHPVPQRREAAGELRAPRPLRRRVPVAAQPRHRFEGQHLHAARRDSAGACRSSSSPIEQKMHALRT